MSSLQARVAKLELGQPSPRWVPPHPAMIVLDESDPASVANYQARVAAIEADLAAHGYERREGDPPVMYTLCGPDPDGLYPDPALYRNPEYAWNGVPWRLCLPGAGEVAGEPAI